MHDSSVILFGLFIICIVVCSVFFASKREKVRADLEFDSLVLGFVDGLLFSGLICEYIADVNIRRYVEDQLSKAHQLPGNQALIEYTTEQGRRYYSWTSKNEHALFAILCIAQFSKKYGESELTSWCESVMEEARRVGIKRLW